MVSIVEFKDKAIGKLDRFRAYARALPSLMFARYARSPKGDVPGPLNIKVANKSGKHHRQHQMHSQHRETTTSVLQWLVRHLDIRTRECVFVNPTRGIRRPPYVPELARAIGSCERTVTRCLASLTRSGLLLRSAKRFFLSRALFSELKLDVTFDRLSNQLAGLAKRKAFIPSNAKAGAATKPTVASDATSASHREFVKPDPTAPPNVELGRSFLDALKGRRSRKPPG